MKTIAIMLLRIACIEFSDLSDKNKNFMNYLLHNSLQLLCVFNEFC